jgi:hypothetical protein
MVFIYVQGEWYAKPSCAAKATPIQPDGTWSANITPNVNDKAATEIAAFLVPTNYNPACVNGADGLPIPAQAEAEAYATRVAPSARQFNFAGYEWSVKTSSGGLSGPGPNYFSNSTNNVWLDAQGSLHLRIAYANGGWQCAEIISERSFGYGQYRFMVQADVNNMDANAVLGLFTYANDTAYNSREIDIELSHWNYAFGSNDVVDYAVAPYDTGELLRFPVAAGVTNSAHSFIWQSNSIAFQSLNGAFSPAPAASNVLERWTCTTGVPPEGGEQVHINLWLDKGNPPTLGQPVEVVLSQFEFVPLGPPPPATLNPALGGLPRGPVGLSGQGVMDWHYQVQASSNLVDWLNVGTALATNSFLQFIDTNPVSPSARFYRVKTGP